MIFTGCYTYTDHYKGLLVGVSRKVIDSNIVYPWLAVAPTNAMLNDLHKGVIDRMQFIEKYKTEVLGKLSGTTKDIIRDYLEAFKDDEDLFLLCYESSGKFCHRHILADWIEETFGIPVKEYDITKSRKEQ